MFTGIIEAKGAIVETRGVVSGRKLCIHVGAWAEDCRQGDSVCVSGACLTVTAIRTPILDFDVVKETLDKTTLGEKRRGDVVNLERSLRVGDRLDGHFVQGHVDGTGIVKQIKSLAEDWTVWFQPQAHLLPCIIPKGSIAIDGVSLTVAAVRDASFSVALIPTTLKGTTMASLKAGEVVNLESDVIARTIAHQFAAMKAGSVITMETLAESGFA